MGETATATDVTVVAIDDMEPVHGGLMRRARAALGVSAWGMQVFDLPPGFEHYPEHSNAEGEWEAGQEEVYIPLAVSVTVLAGAERYELELGVWARVGPGQPRRLLPGPEGLRYVALGGIPGTFEPAPWSELGGPVPGE